MTPARGSRQQLQAHRPRARPQGHRGATALLPGPERRATAAPPPCAPGPRAGPRRRHRPCPQVGQGSGSGYLSGGLPQAVVRAALSGSAPTAHPRGAPPRSAVRPRLAPPRPRVARAKHPCPPPWLTAHRPGSPGSDLGSPRRPSPGLRSPGNRRVPRRWRTVALARGSGHRSGGGHPSGGVLLAVVRTALSGSARNAHPVRRRLCGSGGGCTDRRQAQPAVHSRAGCPQIRS
jgi:hypothetical protein